MHQSVIRTESYRAHTVIVDLKYCLLLKYKWRNRKTPWSQESPRCAVQGHASHNIGVTVKLREGLTAKPPQPRSEVATDRRNETQAAGEKATALTLKPTYSIKAEKTPVTSATKSAKLSWCGLCKLQAF